MISAFAEFASESSKAGRLKSGVCRVADISSTVPPLGALHGRINGFTREHRALLRSLGRTGGALPNTLHATGRSQRRRHAVIDHDWVHS
jgi:hypothetical protein